MSKTMRFIRNHRRNRAPTGGPGARSPPATAGRNPRATAFADGAPNPVPARRCHGCLKTKWPTGSVALHACTSRKTPYSEMARWRQFSRSSLHIDVCDLNNIAHPRGRVIDRPLLPACCSCPVLPPPDAISDSAAPPIAFRDDDCGIHARCSAQAVVGQTRMYRPGHLRVPGIPVERGT